MKIDESVYEDYKRYAQQVGTMRMAYYPIGEAKDLCSPTVSKFGGSLCTLPLKKNAVVVPRRKIPLLMSFNFIFQIFLKTFKIYFLNQKEGTFLFIKFVQSVKTLVKNQGKY
jgi:hypothetical protein